MQATANGHDFSTLDKAFDDLKDATVLAEMFRYIRKNWHPVQGWPEPPKRETLPSEPACVRDYLEQLCHVKADVKDLL